MDKTLDPAQQVADDKAVALPDKRLVDAAVGDAVWLATLKKEGVIVNIDNKRSRAQVSVGSLRLWADMHDLRAIDPKGRTTQTASGRGDITAKNSVLRNSVSKNSPTQRATSDIKTSDNTIDIRGMRVDDALAMLETSIDRIYPTGVRYLYIYHGIGSGALKQAVSEWLTQNKKGFTGQRYVASFAPAEKEDGGPGVTRVEIH